MSSNTTHNYALILIDSFVEKEPRVIREIEALKNAGIVPITISDSKNYPDTICYPLPELDGKHKYKHFTYPFLLRKAFTLINKVKARMRAEEKKTANQIVEKLVEKGNFKCVIAHHQHILPISYYVAKKLNTKLLFNIHEYYPEQFTGSEGWEPKRRYLNKIGHDFLKHCYKIFNVCDGIQKRYEQEFHLKAEQQLLVMNAASFNDLPVIETEGKINVIHHGIADEKRKLEMMFEVADLTDKDRFQFYFMLIPSSFKPDYFEMLKQEITKRPNCEMLTPVTTTEIGKTINKYDVGLYMYDNSSNFNMQHYLPNKLFEFIQARLAVVIGPYVEMKKIVDEHQIGLVAAENKPKALAACLNSLTKEQISNYKNNAAKAAKTLAGENEIAKMQSVFESL